MNVVPGEAFRQVTDDEVDFFADRGYVKLPRLISPELAGELLARAQAIAGPDCRDGDKDPTDRKEGWFYDRHEMHLRDDLYAEVYTDRSIGVAAARLLGRDMPIRAFLNLVVVKPAAPPEGEWAPGETPWHQDYGGIPVVGTTINFWIALNKMTPDMGTVQFMEGSHRLGIYGHHPERWPRLDGLPTTEPMTLEPGDATSHMSLMFHRAGTNVTDTPRWGFIVLCFPADAPYTGGYKEQTDGLGLVPGQPIDHPRFPLLYDPVPEPAVR